jgi:hypothetical protein
MQVIFAGTLFVSAALLFCVQPMIAKMILPLLGGSPAVWNSCMVFFQAALLGGYLYAHAVGSWLPLRVQPAVHLGVLAVPLLVLPIALPVDVGASVPHDAEPVLWVLRLLLLTVGLPFFVVSTTAPLLQKWFSQTGHHQAGDPYFLYAASNLGSMLTLLAYPIIIEPLLSLADQRAWWRTIYIVLVLMTAMCAVLVWRFGQPVNLAEPSEEPVSEAADTELTIGRRLRWILLAFVPSSLMLGVTTFITTDIATIPFLWVMPLALYLVSFILVFARRRLLSPSLMGRLLPIPTLIVAITLVAGATLPVWALIGLHWLVLFLAAMVCHGALADDRPAPRHLTEFYLWLSVGGVLGGVANALVAPLVFRGGIYEYPLVLVLACLLRPTSPKATPSNQRVLDYVLPAGLTVAALILVWLVGWLDPDFWDLEAGFRDRLIVLGVLAFVCYTFVGRPVRFALGLGVLLLFLPFLFQPKGRDLFVERNFFGVIHVQDDPTGKFRQLIHGNTVHGVQRLKDGLPDPNCEPLTYYHPTGPIGQVFDVFNARPAPQDVGLAGLGIGALAYYARREQHWTYYEIDPAIESVARNPEFFTFLKNSKAGDRLKVITGDARLKMKEAKRGSFGLIVIDAFSSDSVPVHLLSREALELYRSKLTGDGILAFHISNRYLDLEPVLANLAGACEPVMVCYGRQDLQLNAAEKEAGKKESRWVVLAREKPDLGTLADDPRWQRLQARPGARVWTDDFSNLWEVLRKY